MTIDRKRLVDLLDYDADTGVFVWRVRRGRIQAGARAGTIAKEGYRVIQIDWRIYRAGRLAWFYITGVWPVREIDHFDRDPANDSFRNLRDVDDVQQARNKAGWKRNPTGMRGVTVVKPSKERGTTSIRYAAHIGVGGKQKWLGQFATIDEAIAARRAAEIVEGY